jgi:hypothetical protein
MSPSDDDGKDAVRAAIAAVEEVRDPLDGLLERTVSDPGAVFAAEVLERLATLKRDDRAAFEALRAQLKNAGCRVTAIDEAIAEESGVPGGRGPKQADILIDLAKAAELFHAPDGTGFADLDINGHRETWPIRARGFRRWLVRCFFEETQGAPSSDALQSALNVIEAKAHFDAPERMVHVRVGGIDEKLYLDLADHTWRAVEIDATGWRVIDNPPVRFRRAAGMRALPTPVSGGSITTLRSFLNVKTEQHGGVLPVARREPATARRLHARRLDGRLAMDARRREGRLDQSAHRARPHAPDLPRAHGRRRMGGRGRDRPHRPRRLPLRRSAAVLHLPRRGERHRLRAARRQAARARPLFSVPKMLSPRARQPE